MAAIIRLGGRQYTVNEGDRVRVDLIEGKPGESVKIDTVLAVLRGEDAVFGKPYVEGASVEAKVLGRVRGKKIIVFKYKPKKRIRVRTGHRQHYVELEIEKIITA